MSHFRPGILGFSSPISEVFEGCKRADGSAGIDSPNATCEDQCESVYSFDNLFTRQYQDEKVDLSVKVAGGYLKIYRVYNSEKWQFGLSMNINNSTSRKPISG
jgi:hypothetical protein